MRDFTRRHRPTPGTVFGLLALIVALAGTAIAGPLATTSILNKKEKKQTRNIAKNEINKAAGNLSVRRAQTAGTADNATNATNATNAANAGQVDGHDAVCPDGTFLESGLCFDTAVRFPMATWTNASQLCADAGGHLPTPSELQQIRDRVDLGPVGDGHWTDMVWDDGGTLEALTVYSSAGAIEVHPIANFNQVRCAFELVR